MASKLDCPLVTELKSVPGIGAEAVEMFESPDSLSKGEHGPEAFCLIFSQLFNDSREIRADTMKFFSQVKNPSLNLLNCSELLEKLSQTGEYHKWMIDHLGEADNDALEIWSAIIQLYKSVIHMATSNSIKLLNSLLAIVEKGFKHSNADVRRSSYKAWIVLMDIFAEEEEVLCNPKRIKLITRPLVGNISTRNEDQIRTKFDSWWHYLGLFKGRLVDVADDVVVPFLNFCYFNVGTSANPTQSPAKRFSTLRSLFLEAMAVLICGSNNVKLSHIDLSTISEGLKDGNGIIRANVFVKQHKVLLECVTEAYSVMRYNNKSEVGHMSAIIQTLGSMVKDLCSSGASKDAVTNYLGTLHALILHIKRTIATEEDSYNQVSLGLTIFDTISKLPMPTLTSTKSLPETQSDPLSLVMIRLLLSSSFGEKLSDHPENEKIKFVSVFERLVLPLGQQRLEGLGHLDRVLQLLSDSKGLKDTKLMTLWKNLARVFEENLFKFSEVNQSRNNLEVDISASQNILLFPFLYFPFVTSKQVWNQWTKLYNQISELAETVTLYQTLSLENHLATKMQEHLSGKQISADVFSNLIRHLCENIVPPLKQQLASQLATQQGDDRDLANGKAVVDFVAFMASRLPDFAKDRSTAISISPVAKLLCKQVGFMVDCSSGKSVIKHLLQILSPALVTIVDLKLMTAFGLDYYGQVEILFDRIVNTIQARYDGPFSVEFLGQIKPFLVVALSHHKAKIHAKAKALWEITWGKELDEKLIPDDIQTALKTRSFTDLSSSSSSGFESPSRIISTPPSFRSFLDRSKKETPTKFAKPEPAPSPVGSAKKSGKPLFSLEDENSADFVKIAPVVKKRRPLTEHQKEKLTSRSDDIPALYSELSRDESSLNRIPSQFDSQLSIDESSMMAMDASDVQVLQKKAVAENEAVNAESKENEASTPQHESKRKQSHPHKHVAPVGGSRKRKCEDEPQTHETLEPPAKKRGRQTTKRSVVNSSQEKGTAMAQKSQPTVSPSKVTNQISRSVEVNVPKLNLTSSPVKIIQEEPLKYEPAPVSASRKIDFPEPTTDDELIESSQDSTKQNSARKRRSLDDSKMVKRSSSRRSTLNLVTSSSSEAKSVESKNSTCPKISRNKHGETELHVAVKRKNIDKVRELLSKNAEVNTCDCFGWTPLHETISDDPLRFEILKLLIGHKADVNAKSKNGETPLHDAVKFNSQEVTDYLIEHGANPDIPNEEGQTPRDIAPHLFKALEKSSSSAQVNDCTTQSKVGLLAHQDIIPPTPDSQEVAKVAKDSEQPQEIKNPVPNQYKKGKHDSKETNAADATTEEKDPPGDVVATSQISGEEVLVETSEKSLVAPSNEIIEKEKDTAVASEPVQSNLDENTPVTSDSGEVSKEVEKEKECDDEPQKVLPTRRKGKGRPPTKRSLRKPASKKVQEMVQQQAKEDLTVEASSKSNSSEGKDNKNAEDEVGVEVDVSIKSAEKVTEEKLLDVQSAEENSGSVPVLGSSRERSKYPPEVTSEEVSQDSVVPPSDVVDLHEEVQETVPAPGGEDNVESSDAASDKKVEDNVQPKLIGENGSTSVVMEPPQKVPTADPGKVAPAVVTKPLPKPALPFPPNRLSTVSPLSKVSRGSKILEMAKAKYIEGSSPTLSSTSVHRSSMSTADLMSPKPEVDNRSREDDVMSTPTQRRPWQRYVPSPVNASPSAGILKRSLTDGSSADEEVQAPAKRRRVQFKDPPVSCQVEIPRESSGKATRLRAHQQQLFLPRYILDFGQKSANGSSTQDSQPSSVDSIGSYESSQTYVESADVNPNCVFPTLANCEEPIGSVIHNLASRPWEAAARNDLKENQINTIGDLARLTRTKAVKLKYLKPANNFDTIRNALRIFAKSWIRREKERHINVKSTHVDDTDQSPTKKSGIASIIETSTPEEEDQTMKEIYDRPSPTPAEDLSTSTASSDGAGDVDDSKARDESAQHLIESQEIDEKATLPEAHSTEECSSAVPALLSDDSALTQEPSLPTVDKEVQLAPETKAIAVQHVMSTSDVSTEAAVPSAHESSQTDDEPLEVKKRMSLDFLKSLPKNEILECAMELINHAKM